MEPVIQEAHTKCPQTELGRTTESPPPEALECFIRQTVSKRGGKTRKPKQDDLYGGRIIDATSERTMFVWQNEGRDYIVIDKNRNGSEGDIEVFFEKKYNRFRSVENTGD